jgi:hypothetical protein
MGQARRQGRQVVSTEANTALVCRYWDEFWNAQRALQLRFPKAELAGEVPVLLR